MRHCTGKSETSITEYQGKPLASFGIKDDNGNVITEVPYDWEWDEYEGVQELKDSGNFPSDARILKDENESNKRTAKAGAYQKSLSKFKAAYENTTDFKRKQFIDSALAMGFDRAEAEALAQSKVK